MAQALPDYRSVFKASLHEFAPDVQLKWDEKGYGLVAATKTSIGKPLIEIPSDQVLTPFDNCPYIPDDFEPDEKLALIILYRKYLDKEISPANAALQYYPKNFYSAHFWEPIDYEFYYKYSLNKYKVHVSQKDKKACAKFKRASWNAPEVLFDCEKWKWAFGVINTRAFYLKYKDLRKLRNLKEEVNPEEKFAVILVYIDLLNHDAIREGDQPSELVTVFPGKVMYKSHRNYQKGDELLSWYGNHTNHETLKFYGFVMQDNPYDTIFIARKLDSKCRGRVEDKLCVYELDVDKPNFNFLLSILVMLEAKEESVKMAEKVLMGLEVEEYGNEEFEDVLKGFLWYKAYLKSFRNKDNSVPLRQIRRQKQQLNERLQVISSYCEIERVNLYRHEKALDEFIIRLLYSSI